MPPIHIRFGGYYHAWPAEIRLAVEAAARAAEAAQRAMAAAEDREVLAKLDPAETEIVRLTEAERVAFIDAVAPVVADWREHLGDWTEFLTCCRMPS